MTNEELENKIEELSMQIEALKEELKETPKGEIWKPIEGEEYWFIDFEDNNVARVFHFNGEVIENGNAYPTKEKAEFEAQREKYTRLFRQYVEQHSEPLDWDENDWDKWYVFYDYNVGEFGFDNTSYIGGLDVFGSSREVMEDAVNFIGADNLKKYVFGIEDKYLERQ